jgi:hypothetical protein
MSSTTEIPGVMPDQDGSSIVLQRGKHAPQWQSLNTKANLAKSGNDRRRFQRVNIPLLGRFMRENKQEYPCQIVNVSAGGIAVRAAITGEMGERIVIYIDTLGRIEGKIVRVNEDGFALQLSASGYKREKIANQLTWLVNKDRLSILEDRRHNRIIPKKTTIKITMDNGESYDCHILDVSLGGAAVWVEPKPEVGEPVILGLTPGHVVRHTEQGISIEFLEIQDPDTLKRQFG